jgi:hypothetical protein
MGNFSMGKNKLPTIGKLMKTITKQLFRGIPIITALAGLLATRINTFAIEGIHLSVQSSNVILSWPSTNNGESYVIQYRQTLSTTDAWQTLADYYSPASDTNITFYTNFNAVQKIFSYGDSSFAALSSSQNIMALAPAESVAPVPMAIPADGSGGAVPLAIYPPGFDLSGFLIYDPLTGETVNGSGYSANTLALSSPTLDAPQPLDGGASGNGSPSPTPATGFYRVVRDGAHLFGITNGMTLSGVVTIPVEVANGYGDLVNLSLTENDSPVNGVTSQDSPISLPLQLTVDTTLMDNGVHQISASARWDDTNGGVWEVTSPPVTINVFNEISFPKWMPRFGELYNSLYIAVQSAHTDADWWIDIYDSQYVYIGTFSGHTYDGNIEGYWDLLGPSGEFHGDDTFYFMVTTEWTGSLAQQGGGAGPAAAGSAHTTAPTIWRVTDNWISPGAWVVVSQHAFDFIANADLLYNEITGFVQGAGAGGDTVLPSPDGDGNPYGLVFQTAGEAANWTAFRTALYDARTRNLVYFGHGGPHGLGYNQADPTVSISAADIAAHLHTIPDNQTNRHAFRFVLLDGCGTGQGNLPEAFGIIHRENLPIDPYADAAIRPSAFAGWDKQASIGFLGTEFSWHIAFIQEIQIHMNPSIYNEGIKSAIHSAANSPDVNSPSYETHFKVFGFGDLHYYQYN